MQYVSLVNTVCSQKDSYLPASTSVRRVDSIIKLIKMLQIQDYRNGRYQGHLSNNMPHGIGIFMHISLTFVIAEWSQGQLDGKAIVIFSDGSTFCGNFSRSVPKGPSFYELSMDQIQILQIAGSGKQCRGAILLPLQSKIIELGSPNYQIEKEYKVTDNKQALELYDVAQIIGLSESYKKFYHNYPNCYTFFENYFCQTYPDTFEEIVITLNGYKEYWIGFKQEGLGIRLQPVQQSPIADKRAKNNAELTKAQHRCLDGRVYMIRQMGMMSKDNTLTEYGLKSINELLKGYTIQEGIFQLPHTITKYQSTTHRPKACAQTFANHLKRSFHYKNAFMDMSVLQQISKNKTIMEEDIVGLKKEVLAHSLIERPNKRKQVDESEEDHKVGQAVQQESTRVSPSKRGESFISGNKNWSSQLQEVKKEIYNSIQLKKSNKNLPNVDYTNIKKLQIEEPLPIKKSPEKKVHTVAKQTTSFSNRPVTRNQKNYLKNDSLTKDKSKSRDYIELRKNGSITPRKKYDYVREEKPSGIITPSKSPPKAQVRTTPGYILQADKSKASIKTSPIKQRVAYRDSNLREVPQLKKQSLHQQDAKYIAAEKHVDRRLVPDGEKRGQQNNLLREKQSRSYLSRNKKKRLLNQLDNFQL